MALMLQKLADHSFKIILYIDKIKFNCFIQNLYILYISSEEQIYDIN